MSTRQQTHVPDKIPGIEEPPHGGLAHNMSSPPKSGVSFEGLGAGPESNGPGTRKLFGTPIYFGLSDEWLQLRARDDRAEAARERARRGSSEQRSGERPPRGACCALDEELVAGHDVEHHAEHEPPRARRARRRDAAAAAVVGRHHRNGSRAAQRATGEHRLHVSTELFMLRVVKLLIC